MSRLPKRAPRLRAALGLAACLALAAAWRPGGEPVEAQLRQAAAELLAGRFPGRSLEVRVVRTGGLPAEAADLRVRLPESAELPRAHVRVDVLAADAAGAWREAGWALLYVAHFDTVLVARRSLRAGEPVDDEAVEAAWMETTSFRRETLRRAELAAALVADRPVRAGAVLHARDVRAPHVADVGDAVRLRYDRHGVRFEMRCQAREAGGAGDAVRVYCPDVRATYRARLSDGPEAEWIETL